MDSTSISTRLEQVQTHVIDITVPNLLILLFTASFAIHLSIIAIFINQPIALDDMYQYDMLARSLSEGNGYRWYAQSDVAVLKPYLSQFIDLEKLQFPKNGLLTTFRSPGYSFFLAGLYMLVPTAYHWMLARIVQAGIMAVLAPFAAVLALLLGLKRRAAAFTGVGISLYPILLFYPIGLASEDLYIILAMCSLILLLVAVRKKSYLCTVLAGLSCGLLIFTRAIFAGFVLLAAIWLGRYHPTGKKAGLILAVLAFGLCLPWCIRNSIIMQRPAFIENSLGYNLYVSYHPEGNGGFASEIAIKPLYIIDDTERDQYCMQQALSFILQDPLRAIHWVFGRVIKFFGPEDREFFYFYTNNLLGAIPQPWLALLYLLLVIPWISTLFFGIYGLWQLPDKKTKMLFIVLLIGYSLPFMLILAEPRFHLALAPALIPIAFYGWEQRTELRWTFFLNKSKLLLAILLSAVILILVLSLGSNGALLMQIMSPGGNELYLPY